MGRGAGVIINNTQLYPLRRGHGCEGASIEDWEWNLRSWQAYGIFCKWVLMKIETIYTIYHTYWRCQQYQAWSVLEHFKLGTRWRRGSLVPLGSLGGGGSFVYSEVYSGPERNWWYTCYSVRSSLQLLQVSMSQSIALSRNPGGLEMHAQMYCIVYME